MNRWIDCLAQKWTHHKRQMRLEQIRAELEQAQSDCAALGAHIGWLIARKTELETELQRQD